MITSYVSTQCLSSTEQVVDYFTFLLSLSLHEVPKASKWFVYHRIPYFLIVFVPIAYQYVSM